MIDIEKTQNECAFKRVKKLFEKIQLRNEIIVFVKKDIHGLAMEVNVFLTMKNVRNLIEAIHIMKNLKMPADANHDMSGIQIVQVV